MDQIPDEEWVEFSPNMNILQVLSKRERLYSKQETEDDRETSIILLFFIKLRLCLNKHLWQLDANASADVKCLDVKSYHFPK